MKSASLPAVRVDSELREDLESVWADKETISSLVEQAVRGALNYRPAQADFLARGEREWQNYIKTGVSIPADEVFARLEKRIEARRQELLKSP